MRKTFARAVTIPLAALCLSGCLGGLLGGGKPSQAYRFGATFPEAPHGPLPAPSRVVQLNPVEFADEIDTDRLLASRGAETFYIKGARWVSPAPQLFTAALHDAIRRRVPDIVLVDRRDSGRPAPALRVSIMRFEAIYPNADKTAVPEIRIEGMAMLDDGKSREALARLALTGTQPAASGRIDDLVAAFDAADAQVIGALVDWLASRPASATERPVSPN